MFKKRFISMLVLLAAVVTGAWADQLASSYSSNATLNAVTVSASMEVTIATGVTVTINNGLNITSGTLTVKGPGTLVVNGKAGSNGGRGETGGNGTPGSAAITGNIEVMDNATIQANGGAGGNGGFGDPEMGGNGANGAAAISGNVTVLGGATVKATGGNGGNGGNSDMEIGGNGGNGGVAFAGTLTYKGGTVTADGGNGGSGGSGHAGSGHGGSAGKAFTTSVNFVSSDYILTDGSNAITATQVTSKKKVVISPKVAVNSVTLAPTSATLTLGETETVTLIPTVLPDNATDKTVTWTTSDASVATVADGVVTAVAPGTATITATATNGTADTSDDQTATCEVTVSYPTYNLTANEETGNLSGLNDYKGKTCTVTYARSFTAGKTSTVCLPFAYTKKEGDGSFYAFTNIEKVGSEYVATMTEPISTTLEANTPYLYLPNATGDVDFGGAYTIPSELTADSYTSGDWTFKGTFETIEWTTAPIGTYGFSAQDQDGISQGQFVKVGDYVRISPMRCYLEYIGDDSQWSGVRGKNRVAAKLPETIKVRLIGADGTVTAIGSLSTTTGEMTTDGAWYSINGTRLNGTPATKGIYVRNGKKAVIK